MAGCDDLDRYPADVLLYFIWFGNALRTTVSPYLPIKSAKRSRPGVSLRFSFDE
jgi:hypothetical protein